MINKITNIVGLDKLLHFLGCYFIASFSNLILDSLIISVIIGIVVGLAKEIGDPKFSWGDIIANCAGVLAFLLGVLFNILIY